MTGAGAGDVSTCTCGESALADHNFWGLELQDSWGDGWGGWDDGKGKTHVCSPSFFIWWVRNPESTRKHMVSYSFWSPAGVDFAKPVGK